MYIKQNKTCLHSKVLISVTGHSVTVGIYNITPPYLANIAFAPVLVILV